MSLNIQELKGQWNQLTGQMKKKWGNLTDDDLKIAGGNVDMVIGKIQQKTGEARETVEKYINELSSKASHEAGSDSGYAATAKDYVAQAADSAREYASQANEHLKGSYEKVERTVKDSPVPVMAAAFGVGVLVGLLVAPSVREWRS